MKKNIILSLLVAFSIISNAQIFLQGNRVEIGIHSFGSYGSDNAAPAGYHPTNGNLGFVCDYTSDGWAAGSPVYMGDYFVPGSPEEGWGVEWNVGATSYNFNNFGLNFDTDIPMISNTDESTADEKVGVWVGEAVNGAERLRISQTTRLGMNNLYFTIEVMMLNTGTVTLESVEYLRNVDPDNEIEWTGDYTTSNYVAAQPGVAGNPDVALVCAYGLVYGAPLFLGTIDDRARVSVEGFSNRDPDDIYDSPVTPTQASPSVYDEAVALAYRFGDLAPGECVTFTYFYGLEEVDPGDVVFPLTVEFTHYPNDDLFEENCSGTGSNAIIAYNWDFDNDGVFDATGETATYDFPTGGNQSVTLSVTLCNGEVHDTTIVICDFAPDLGDDVSVCSGSNVVLDPGPGTSFSWDPGGQTTPTISVNTPGTYSVTVTDANGCTGTDEIIVSIGSTLTPDLGPDVSFCAGNSVTLDPGTYDNYSWTGGSTDPTLEVTTSGTYSVTVSDGVGCSGTDQIVVTVNPVPTISFSIDSIECFGDATTISYTGSGVAGDTYTWDFDGGTIASGSGMGPYSVSWGSAGVHTISLEVETAAGCVNSGTQSLSEAPELTASLAINNHVSCGGYTDGSATVTATGGFGTLSYDWSNSTATTATVSTLGANTYQVTVSDQHNCSVVTNSIVITEPNPIAVVETITDIQCYGYNDGEILLNVSGGQNPYTYSWNGGFPTTNPATDLDGGNQTVTITDGNGCTASFTFFVDEPPVFAAEITSSENVSCYNVCDGSATVAVTGGVNPYTIRWPSNNSNAIENNLCDGTYIVTITDANLCTTSAQVVITEPDELIVNITSSTNISCFGYNDGTATVEISGGTIPYMINWSSGTGTFTATGMNSGLNTVSVTDLNGCAASDNVTLSEPPQLTSTITGTDLECHGYNNGAVNLTVNGGTNPYTYWWSNGISDEDLTGISGGNYGVTVTDGNGCTLTNSISIYEPPAIVITTSPNSYICIDQSAIVSASATGGQFPYSYMWNGSMPGASQSVSPVTDQTYNVVVTDGNGCTNSASVTVFVYDSLDLSLAIVDPIICLGEPAVINSTFSGGNGGPYILTLEDGTYISNPFTDYPTENETYRIMLQDWCGTPPVYADISVIVIDPPVVSFTGDDLDGCEPHQVQFNAYSDDSQLNYDWDFGNGGFALVQNPVHVYNFDGLFDVSVTVTDIYGCKTTVTYEDMITVYPLPEASFRPEPARTTVLKPHIYFNNLSSSYVMYNYWFFDDGDSSSVVSPLHTYPDVEATYEVTLITETQYGCKDTTKSFVYIDDVYAFHAPTAFSPNRDMTNDIFFVWGYGIDAEQFHLYIYDRWGELVFDTDKYNHEDPAQYGWDGRIKGNKYAESGMYSWLVIYRDFKGVEHQQAGGVVLLR
ncbi:MAG: gliding motility-associated C-terminal domain-containing protein [Bacteroidales bacterium]|nr:gliding motility-associated C-terminal domain-containing protein [Bacteroidales bacterium]